MSFDFAASCWFITGATASGKTAVGLELADLLAAEGGAEILSLDSMAVYRGMDIGTAKPGPAEQAHTPHHLIDLRDPDQEFSVAEYRDAAEAAARDVLARGKTPVFVGGTPMYLKCLLRGLFEGPGADWNLRRDLEAELEQYGVAALHERLTLVDPVAASNIHRNDARRIVRALEVFRTTGQPISHQQLEFDDARPAAECRVFVLRRDRADQHARIEARVEEMMAEGLVDEVRALTSGGRTLGRSASQAVGYREVLDYLAAGDGLAAGKGIAAGEVPAGEHGLEATVERIQARTRRFAKRQGTWFRSLSECRFVEVAPDDTAAEIAGRLVEAGH